MMMNPWIQCLKPNPSAKLRLFCFPFAGSGASMYRDWGQVLPNFVEVCAVKLPGREGRLQESPYYQLPRLIEQLSLALRSWLDLPFAIFGHSLGALLGFEFARWIQHNQRVEPIHLFVSGCRAPQKPNPHPSLHRLPDREFLDRVCQQYRGIPTVVLREPELLDVVLPALRADFVLVDTYKYRPTSPFHCRISSYGGTNDSTVSETDLEAWREQTLGTFNSEMFTGSHLFIQDGAKGKLLETVSLELANTLYGSTPVPTLSRMEHRALR